MSKANLIVVMGISLLIAQACTKDSPRDTSQKTIASPVKLPMDLQREHCSSKWIRCACAALFATETSQMVWLEPSEGAPRWLQVLGYQDGVWGST